ncbi:MAG: YihY/virulence factor BrkB family protein [Candidatus Zixiibacteriota bacterium]|nr:MAG: YihY/virulence factor BrkB family protein [candidate division Zixibacteria bacterium]
MDSVKKFSKKALGFLKYYFGGLYEGVGKNHIFLFGGGLAFSVIICMVPFVLIIFYFLGRILESQTVSQQIDLFIDTVIPYLQYSNKIKMILHTSADEVIAYKNIAGYTGVVGLLFAASGLFSSMRTSLNRIFKTNGPSAYVGKLRDLGMVVLVLIFIMLATTVFPVLEIVKDSADKIEILKRFQMTGAQGKFYFIGSLLTMFVLFFTLYNLIPNRRLGFKVSAVGAFWAALLWVAAKEIFGYYITNIASLKRIYGTYMLFAVLTFWIYYSSVVFLVGAQIAQLYRERRALRIKGD